MIDGIALRPACAPLFKIADLVQDRHPFAMPAAKKKSSAPLTFDLPASLIAKIARVRKHHGLGSASEVVRVALARFDFAKFNPPRDPHAQISVRIAGNVRATLRRTARQKDACIGELIRAALETLPEKPAPNRKPR